MIYVSSRLMSQHHELLFSGVVPINDSSILTLSHTRCTLVAGSFNFNTHCISVQCQLLIGLIDCKGSFYF